MNRSEYASCRLCPRECGVNRLAGRRGFCGETAVCRIASAEAHFGEEPPFTGRRGSGTIFFSGCSSRCFFCQNYQISQGGIGTELDMEELVAAAERLIGQGVHNLNFVTPDHFWPHIRDLAWELRRRGHSIPLLWNSSGYHRADRISEYAEAVDIFLPDFKFADSTLAHCVMGDGRYPEFALSSLRAMVEAKGFLEPFDETGGETARRGVLVRHLVLPGHIGNSIEVLRLLHREFGSELPLSLMSQFRPVAACRTRGMLARRLSLEEYRRVCDEAERLGFDRAFIQPEPGDEAFFPDFEKERPFEGNLRAVLGIRSGGTHGVAGS